MHHTSTTISNSLVLKTILYCTLVTVLSLPRIVTRLSTIIIMFKKLYNALNIRYSYFIGYGKLYVTSLRKQCLRTRKIAQWLRYGLCVWSSYFFSSTSCSHSTISAQMNCKPGFSMITGTVPMSSSELL